MANTRKSTAEKTKESRERMASNSGKKAQPPPGRPARPLTDDEKTVKLQEQELKIAALEMKLAGSQKKQGCIGDSQGSLTDSQASVPSVVSSEQEKKRKASTVSSAVVLSNSGLKKHIKEIVKLDIWRTRKFVNNQDQVEEICAELLEISDQLKPLWEDTKNRKAYIKSLAQNYGGVICSTINEKRTNIQSALQKAYTKRFSKGEAMPTYKELRAVVLRKGLEYINTDRKEGETEEAYNKKLALAQENERNRDFFIWYWLELLPAGAAKGKWTKKIRFFGTITDHAPLDNPEDKYITTSDETLIVLMFENCSKRFPYVAECKRKNVVPDKNHADYQARWSVSAAGQNKFGGWEDDGRARFVELRRKIGAAKQKDHVQDLESDILKEIQDKYSKVQAEEEEEEGETNEERERMNELLADTKENVGEAVVLAEGEDSDVEDLDDNFKPAKKKKSE